MFLQTPQVTKGPERGNLINPCARKAAFIYTDEAWISSVLYLDRALAVIHPRLLREVRVRRCVDHGLDRALGRLHPGQPAEEGRSGALVGE